MDSRTVPMHKFGHPICHEIYLQEADGLSVTAPEGSGGAAEILRIEV